MSLDVQPGTLLGDTYRVVRRIGGGSRGDVYEATHARLGQRFAIKLIRPEGGQDAQTVARFVRQAQEISRLRHPGIVTVVDVNTLPDGAAYLAMEYLEGETLAAKVAVQGALPLPRVVDFTDQLSAAVTAAHGERIVHGALRSQNVFVLPSRIGQPERIKILDFAISATSEDADVASDQLALAAIVYEMLTRHAPERAAPKPVRAFRPELSAEIENVIMRGLAPAAQDRFPSVSELALHLRWTARLSAGQAPAHTPLHTMPGRPVRTDADEPTTVSTLPSGMAEVLRQTTGLSHPVQPAPAPSVHQEPTVIAPASAHEEPTVIRASGQHEELRVVPLTDPTPVVRARARAPASELTEPGPRRRTTVAPRALATAGLLALIAGAGLALRGRPGRPAPVVQAAAPAPVAVAVGLPPAPPPRPAAPEPSPPAAVAVPATAPASPTPIPAVDRKVRSRPRPRAPAALDVPASPPAADAPKDCTISLASYPWSDVWIDGSDTGLHTPVIDLALPCGNHRLEFKRRDLHVDQVESVTVKRGDQLKRQYELRGAHLDD